MQDNPGGGGGGGEVKPPFVMVKPMTMAEALVFCARNRLTIVWRDLPDFGRKGIDAPPIGVELVIMKQAPGGDNLFAVRFPQTGEIAEDVTIAEHFFIRHLETYRAAYKKTLGETLE